METLFPRETSYPPGFTYFPDFLSFAEERQLLDNIPGVELHTFNFHRYAARRRVASFGYDYSFDNRSISKGQEIPMVFDTLIEKVADKTGIRKTAFQEVLVTEYAAGSVINCHRDAPPFDVIAGISLLSDCTFRLRPYDKTKRSRKFIFVIPRDATVNLRYSGIGPHGLGARYCPCSGTKIFDHARNFKKNCGEV